MAQSIGASEISLDHCRQTFDLEQIDRFGLNPVHHRYLQILYASWVDGHFAPLGVGSIAAKMRQPEDLIKGSVEPILLELNMVAPTPRGRILTETGKAYLEGEVDRDRAEYFSGKGVDISHVCGILRA